MLESFQFAKKFWWIAITIEPPCRCIIRHGKVYFSKWTFPRTIVSNKGNITKSVAILNRANSPSVFRMKEIRSYKWHYIHLYFRGLRNSSGNGFLLGLQPCSALILRSPPSFIRHVRGCLNDSSTSRLFYPPLGKGESTRDITYHFFIHKYSTIISFTVK